MRALLVLLTLLLGGMAAPSVANGHGPCECLRPSGGPPGTRVRVPGPVYKVVFNPDRADLATGPEDLWRQHHARWPPVVVHRETYRYSPQPPRAGEKFRVPAVAPGRYLVAIYDGSEGGAHYTWATFRVTRDRLAGRAHPRPHRGATPRPTATAARVPAGAAAVAAAAAAVAGFALAGLLSRRRG